MKFRRTTAVIGLALSSALLLGACTSQAPTASVTGEVFYLQRMALPPQAVRLLTNDFCANQMFALGPHLAMQCHVEMTPELIATWSSDWADEARAAARHPAGQTPEQMVAEIEWRLPAMRQLADRLYGAWIANLRR